MVLIEIDSLPGDYEEVLGECRIFIIIIIIFLSRSLLGEAI